jgi:hypothetical protein
MSMQRMYHGRWRDENGHVVQHLVTSEPIVARETWSQAGSPGLELTITQNWVATVASPEEPAVL